MRAVNELAHCLFPAYFLTRVHTLLSHAFSREDIQIRFSALRGRAVTDFTPTRVMTHFFANYLVGSEPEGCWD